MSKAKLAPVRLVALNAREWAEKGNVQYQCECGFIEQNPKRIAYYSEEEYAQAHEDAGSAYMHHEFGCGWM